MRDYRDHSKQGLSNAVALAREGGAVVAEFWSDAGVYYRDMRRIRNVEDLRRFAGEALKAKRDFSVVFGHRNLAMAGMEECVRLTEGMGELSFRKVGEFYGLEQRQFNTYVYRIAHRGPDTR